MAPRVMLVLVLLNGLGASSVARGTPALSLETAARMSPRPIECRVGDGLWPGVELATWRSTCAELARAYTLVDVDAAAAKQLVERAMPSLGVALLQLPSKPRSLHTQLSLVNARAWLGTRHPRESFAAFAAVDKRVPATTWDALSVHDYAAAAALTGHDGLALELYRHLIPLADWLGESRGERVTFEAAAAALRIDPPATRETLNYLSQGNNSSPDQQLAKVRVALVTAARLLSGQASVPPDDVRLLTTEAGDSASAHASLTLPPSDWLLVQTVQEWVRTQQPEVWHTLDDSVAPPGHRRLRQLMLQARP